MPKIDEVLGLVLYPAGSPYALLVAQLLRLLRRMQLSRRSANPVPWVRRPAD